MAFWNIDLTTKDGAESAAQNGGLACFIAAGLTILGIAVIVATHTGPAAELAGGIAGVAVETIVFTIAGFRLRAGKGVIWGGVATLLLVVEIVAKLITMIGLGGIVINAILLVVMINGVRGALALKRGDLDVDDIGKVFD
ncbi:hypothetical protein G4G27_18070 [Sphingomonas sp. So64.6b]|uniref:hypothetical protein n=1 Tax=Sphingomonas sp. So64.6b TaxID=2997354 RepID=UPI001603DE91|nr:hypothetical protein [Sphingomonas sp. So64.6b]QNA85675.1 hypothetical protein G4G27_18070 [Sphingomonas sp. So64.6b]